MADVITRFKLETTQYDSKLRDASKGLAEYTRQATLAGNEFGKFTQKNIEAARALGTITPSATNAKDKVKELVGAFNDAAKAYNALTKEQQQSDFGKAMAESISQLSDKIREAKRELYDMGDAAKKSGGGGLFSGMGDKMSGAIQVFAGNMLTKAAGAVANLGSEIFSSVQQGVELARQGEGIRIAFERLGRGDILDGLRQATHGTVTDLELMKAAVKFNDFKLPVEELGTMLAFAQQKAKDTGQSVDYMTESIVNGLGRKSLMILDNLGLSATEIKDKMAETGDMTKAVGAIIREQMSKAGDYVETAADRAAQANVSLQNKMEELGRKFAPVEEASSQLWTSMKIGILDIIGGPLATLLNQLTEAGRLKNQLNNMNGEPGSGNTKVDQQLKKLNVIKKGGGSDYIFNSTLNGMMEDYNRQIMALDTQIKNGGKKPGAKSGESQDVKYLQQKMDALKIMRDQLAAGAKELSKPVDVKIETKGAEQNVESLKVKLIELEAQRKKAIAAGDTDLRKNLATQISQVKSDIKGLGGTTTTTTTHKATPQEKAANKVKEAERIYSETLLKNSIRLEEGMDSTLEYKKRELSAQERLFDAYNDAYATYQDPAYKKASTEAAEKIRALAGEVKAASDAQEAAMKSARELDAAQRKLADAQQKLAEARATGSATAIYQAQKNVDKQQDVVNRLQNPTLPAKPQQPTGFEALKQTVQAEIKFDQMKVDETALHTLLQTALQNGLDGLALSYEGIQEKIAKGIDIPDSTWEELTNEINDKLKDLGIEPIKIPIETTEKSVATITKTASLAANAVGSIGSAFNAIEDPAAKAAGIVAQAIANIALGFATASAQANTAGTGWGWLAWLAAGAAAMATTIATVHSLTGYAEGGMIKGNSYSGDNIGGMVDGSQFVGLNAGEVVLNASQQNALAQQITGGGMGNVNLTGRLRGTDIILSVDRSLQSMGRGELLVWK